MYVEPSPYTAAHYALPGLTTITGATILGPTRFAAAEPITAARHDWDAALSSARIVVDGSGPETPPGAALLIGAACATGRQVAAYLPRSTYTHAIGREPNHRNPMVQYGVDGSPWINQVERWFGFLADQKIRRGAHKNVQALEADIRAWVKDWNEDPKPFIWTKTAEEILDSLACFCQRISGAGH
ncbi:hypothetical protein [Streptomyces sp. B21-108]|uniref:hypothetical protein n=1 Tax=Streptomyces sp. B21-108 TaxID=3039419 RepID=UPI003FA728E3